MSAVFDEAGTSVGVRRLSNYRKRWNKALGCWSDQEQQDDNCHGSDAFRQWAQAKESGATFNAARPSSSTFKRRGSPMAT